MPEKIGHYTIVSKLGRGGMGVVWKAHEESLNRYVAIKVLGEHLAEDDDFLQRFTREAQAAAGLSHPNIVQIFYIGVDGERHYFVMEYVSGRSAQEMIVKEGRVSNPRAAQIILQAAHGLAAAHDRGIIHRDIKPANLMIDERGLVKVADFGLALPTEAQTRLTATGMLMGTPGYLAPEQCRGEQADHRTDLYALGVTWFELMTGVTPFRSESPLMLIRQILEEEPPDVATLNPEVDGEARRILAKMIAKEREQRYASAHDLISDLEEYVASKGVRRLTAGLEAPVAPAAATVPPIPADAATERVSVSGAVTERNAVPPPPPAGDAAPTEVVTPAQPMAAPVPGHAAAAGAAVAAPVTSPDVAPKKKQSIVGTLVVAALLLLFVGGGALAAVWYGWNRFVADRGEGETEVVSVSDTGDEKYAVPGAAAAELGQQTGMTDGEPSRQSAVEMAATSEMATQIAASDRQGSSPPASSSASAARPTVEAPRQAAAAAATPPAQRQEPVSRPGERLREAVAERRAKALSGVAVAVGGDQGLNQSVSSLLTEKLANNGIEVVDARSLPSVERSLGQGVPAAGALVGDLKNEGYRHLVLVRIDPTGQRDLNYMGRSTTAYSSRVTVQLYDLENGRPLGAPVSESIEYTSLSADREAEKIVRKLVRAVVGRLQ